MTDYLCMTPEELALWQKPSSYVSGVSPCIDCPLEFHLSERAAGRCFREKPYQATARGTRPRGLRGPRPVYRTDAERQAARRDTWRESGRRRRKAIRDAREGAQ